MSLSVLNVLTWVEGTPLATLVRESLWGFPILVAAHIIGLTISVGIVVWFDLRLLGVNARSTPVSIVYRDLMRVAAGGFVLMFVTGGILASGFATAAYGNPYFRAKLAALFLAGVNAFVYHRTIERRIRQWDFDRRTPLPARMAGLISIALWATVIVAGRMVSYTLYSPPP